MIYCDGGWKYHVHLLDPAHAPRVIKVLNAAELAPELRQMESIAGVDMSELKVELFEAKLPIDADNLRRLQGCVVGGAARQAILARIQHRQQ